MSAEHAEKIDVTRRLRYSHLNISQVAPAALSKQVGNANL